jgi:hypothetical protein
MICCHAMAVYGRGDAAAAASPVGTTAQRGGAALAIKEVAAVITESTLVLDLMEFVLEEGLPDEVSSVRALFVDAGSALVNAHGASQLQTLMPLIDGFLENKRGLPEERYDQVTDTALCLSFVCGGGADIVHEHARPTDANHHQHPMYLVFFLCSAPPTPTCEPKDVLGKSAELCVLVCARVRSCALACSSCAHEWCSLHNRQEGCWFPQFPCSDFVAQPGAPLARVLCLALHSSLLQYMDTHL